MALDAELLAFDAKLLQRLTGNDADVWRLIVERTLEITRQPLTSHKAAPGEVVKRDQEIGKLDLFLASCGWELWRSFGAAENSGAAGNNGAAGNSGVERTSERLVHWWAQPFTARAVLILDGLSLRELPWLLQGAEERGFTLHQVAATASELPGETNAFARALGLSSRSQLQANGGGKAHKLQPAQTETVDLPWQDCAGLIDGSPNWLFWHHWPDEKLHDYGTGKGLETLTGEVAKQLSSSDFWAFVDRLATGRRLVITSDHGYAATGYFHDARGDVATHLKQTFGGGRSKAGQGDPGPFTPPVALQLDTPQGAHLLALGRRKWRSQGGYPMLTHGGLSLLEVLSPFVELSRAGG